MPTFAYSARNASGATVKAALDAPTRRDALRQLSSRGLTPLNLSEQGASPKAAAKPAYTTAAAREKATATTAPGGVRLRRSHRLPFLGALHELIGGGLSAGEAVRLLALRAKEPALNAISNGLWDRISEGATLSRAMGAFPNVFDENTVNLIAAGEATGSLNEVLNRLITHLTEQRDLQRQLATALAYPIFLTCVAFGVVIFFLTFLLPRLETLFKSLKGELPFSTRFLIGASKVIWPWGLVICTVLFIVGASAFWTWRNTPEGRKVTDGWLLKLPVIGTFFVARTVLAFSQTLSVLLENGITTADALRMTERQVANRVHREAFNTATDRVLEGEALSKALGRTGCFPDLVLDQLAVGENGGNLAPSLRRIAVNFQKVVSGRLNLFTQLIGTGVLLTVFVFVGFIAYAIVSAVFQLSQTIH